MPYGIQIKQKRLQFQRVIPWLKGINNMNCGMLELLFNNYLLKTSRLCLMVNAVA
jgi:hypothetical protein